MSPREKALLRLPPMHPLDLKSEPGPLTRQALHVLVESAREKAPVSKLSPHAQVLGGAAEETIMHAMAHLVVPPGTTEPAVLPEAVALGLLACQGGEQGLRAFVATPDLGLLHLARVLVAMGFIGYGPKEVFKVHPLADRLLRHYRETHHPSPGLRELASAMHALGYSKDVLALDMLGCWTAIRPMPFRWENDAVWPYFAGHASLLRAALTGEDWPEWNPYDLRAFRRRNALWVLSTFPVLPDDLETEAWDELMAASPPDRPEVRDVLEKFPDHVQRLLAALHDTHAQARISAADWLGRIDARSQMPALEAALRREKSESGRAAMMMVLERLGAPLDSFLDRVTLAEEASRGLEKGFPEDLHFLDIESLPEVRWEDLDQRVDPRILQWFLVQAWKARRPEPSPALRACARAMRPADREAFAEHVLTAWIARDTLPLYTYDEALEATKQQALNFNTPYYAEMYPGRTPDQIFDRHLHALLSMCEGSAIKEKGLLAVVGALGGPAVVPMAQRYLDRWYGQRAHQCLALVRMLGGLDHPMAVQALQGIASRFRTRSIQAEAAKILREVADRKGWTVEELADRTLPTGGFDEVDPRGPLMKLDYGKRLFVARLDAELGIELFGPDGLAISSLPAARKDEDPDLAQEAKKKLSAARRELKSVLKAQRGRLLDAMVTQRAWRFEDWQAHLQRHPVVGRYGQRLAWVAESADGVVRTFRPLDDGTLTDAEDEEVKLQADDRVRVAHPLTVAPEVAKAWIQHFEDYRVEPLFDQFGRPARRPREDQLDALLVDDFEGFLVGTFMLRVRAVKLGYGRGGVRDGGWFEEYRRAIPTLSLEAVITFSGSRMPEEDRTVALLSLHFTPLVETGRAPLPEHQERLPLREVPPVLLSECYADLATIARDGTGYAEDWKERVKQESDW